MIYKIRASTNKKEKILVNLSKTEKFNDFLFHSNKTKKEWESPTIGWSLEDETDIINDVIHVFGSGIELVVNERVKCILENELLDQFIFLDSNFTHNNVNYFYLDIKNIFHELLDEEKSIYFELSEGRRALQKPYLKHDKINNDSAFMIPEKNTGFFFKGEKLLEIIDSNEIKGFKVEKLQ